MIGYRIALAVCFCTVLVGEPNAARADPAGYVSDSFKKVARRLVEQIGTQILEKACPSSKPLCNTIVGQLKGALRSVFAHDDEGVRASIKQLFLDGSIAGLVQVSVADTLNSVPVGDVKIVSPWAQRCIMAAASGKPTRDACLPNAAERAALVKLLVCQNFPKPYCDPIQNLLDRLQNGKTIEPTLAIRAVARLAMMTPIERPDISIYLERIADFTERGVEDGLFPATWAFLTKTDPSNDKRIADAVGELLLYPKPTSAIMLAQDDTTIATDIGACKRDVATFEAWKGARAKFFTDARSAYFNGATIQWSELDALSIYDGCTGKDIRAFLRGVRFFAAPLKTAEALKRVAIPALTVAALVDYIRSSDATLLDKRAAQILAYGIASLGARRLSITDFAANKITAVDKLTSTVRGLSSCEVTLFLRHARVELPGLVAPKTEKCFSLLSGAEVDISSLGTDVFEVARKTLALDAPNSFALLQDVPVEAILRAVNQFAAGNRGSTAKILLRVGIDFLIERVDDLAEKVVGDPKRCENLIGSRFIWNKVDAGCTAHILITVSYKAVADYFWTEGSNSTDSARIGREVYGKLLESPAIGSLPIILNVGLGGNYIRGVYTDFWGDDGYGAATIVDKFGLAVYRRVSARNRFELGPFVGGFLDAIVRTAADQGTSQRFWLFGLTAGWTRINGLDFGFQVHAAAVMPFEFSADRYGYAIGGALVIPFNFVLEKN